MLKHVHSFAALFVLICVCFSLSAAATYDDTTDYASLMIAAAAAGDQAAYDAAAAARAEKIAARQAQNASYQDPGVAGSGGTVSVADVCTAISGGSISTGAAGTSLATQDQLRAIGTAAAAAKAGSISAADAKSLTAAICAVNAGTATVADVETAAVILCQAQGSSTSALNLTFASLTVSAGSTGAYFRGDGSSDDIVYEGGRAYRQDSAGNWVAAEGWPEADGAVTLSQEDLNALIALRLDYSGATAEEKATLHAEAEAIRAAYGYSGGTNGSFYDAAVATGSVTETAESGKTVVPQVVTRYCTTVASVSGNGTVSNAGTKTWKAGTDVAFRMTPDDGWILRDVLVDGISVGNPSSYTLRAIAADHTVCAVFREAAAISSVSLSGDTGGIKSGYGIRLYAAVQVQHAVIDSVTAVNSATGHVYTLECVGNRWTLPVQPDSVTQDRVDYLPVSLPDGVYTWTVTVCAHDEDDPETVLQQTAVLRYTVRGVMYEDDFTGDR